MPSHSPHARAEEKDSGLDDFDPVIRNVHLSINPRKTEKGSKTVAGLAHTEFVIGRVDNFRGCEGFSTQTIYDRRGVFTGT